MSDTEPHQGAFWVQLGGSFAIIASGIAGAFIPYILIKCKSSDGVLVHLNALSAGILLGAAFIHMIPETSGDLNDAVNGYPLSYVFLCLGLILMVWLTRLGSQPHQHQPAHFKLRKPQKSRKSVGDSHSNHDMVAVRSCNHENCHDDNCPHTHELSPAPSLDTTRSYEELLGREQCGCEIDKCITCDQDYVTQINPDCEQHTKSATTDAALNKKRQRCNQLRSVILLLMGLSVHAFTVGLSLGFTTRMNQAIGISLAIILHKWCDTCTQSLSGIRNGLSMRSNLLVTIPLSLVTPAGTWIAMTVKAVSTATIESTVYNCISDALIMFVSGTFLQIIFEEVLAHHVPIEPKNRKDTPCTLSLRMCAMLGGFVFMCAITVIEMFLE